MTRLVSLLQMLTAVLLVMGCVRSTPASTTTTITFTVPEEIPTATVGEPYSYSFTQETNPTGGNPPYSFMLGSGVGFPPLGLTLDVNGELSGTPTAAGTRTFEVCVKDLGGNQSCRKTSLTVKAPEVWKGTFEITGQEDQKPIGVIFTQEYRISGEFTFKILSDGTIEGSGTAQGKYTSSQTSGSGDRYEAEASPTIRFSVSGHYYEGIESAIQFKDLSPAKFTLTGITYWKSGGINGPYPLSSYPIFYDFTFMAIGIEIKDGAISEKTLGWGGMGEIKRTVRLSRED